MNHKRSFQSSVSSAACLSPWSLNIMAQNSQFGRNSGMWYVPMCPDCQRNLMQGTSRYT